MTITPELLRAATGCTQDAADLYAEHLDAACRHYEILDLRQVMFLAQLAHESGGLRRSVEGWGPTPEQLRYEGRADLGNTEPGDGFRFRGRGPIQITGRGNYRRVTQWLAHLGCPDFEAEPDKLMEPKWGAWASAAWWYHNGCNALADADNYIGIGRLINRGSASAFKPANGEQDRLIRYEKAKAAFGALPPPAPALPPVRDYEGAPPPAPEPTVSTISDIAKAAAPIVGGPAGLLVGLAGTLIDVFAPLAREKATKELARHTNNPEVAAQVADAAIEAAKRATGRSDPVEAVAEARKDPDKLAVVQESVLDRLDRLAPVLERMAKIDRETFAAEEASRTAAAQRNANGGNQMDPFLTRAVVWILVLVIVGSLTAIGVMAWFKASETAIMAVFGVLNAAVLASVSKFGTRYDYAYGSSIGSQSKDAVLAGVMNSPRPRLQAPPEIR